MEKLLFHHVIEEKKNVPSTQEAGVRVNRTIVMYMQGDTPVIRAFERLIQGGTPSFPKETTSEFEISVLKFQL